MRSTSRPIVSDERDLAIAGVGVSAGAAVGRVLRLDLRDIAAGLPADFETDAVSLEVERLHAAVAEARSQVLELKDRVASELGRGHAYFFEAHLLMLDDRELLDDVARIIRTRRIKAEWAVKAVLDRMLVVYTQVKDDYLRERGSDIEDVARRLIRVLSGGQGTSLAALQHDVVIVANTLPPSTVAELDLSHVLGFATGDGGFTSHTAIIARSLSIPAVVGLSDVAMRISSGDTIVVDGSEGRVILHPTKQTIRQYLRRYYESRHVEPAEEPPTEAITRDGHRCVLRANIELPSELDAVARFGAKGIGLYRSEFLYLNKSPELPSEDEQAAHFEQLASAAGDHGATIRSFDLGGDKLSPGGFDDERNPALGLRALRLALGSKPIFRTHLRAILRASAKGRLRIVLPLVSRISDIRAVRELLDECKRELEAEGKTFNPTIQLGAMIEVPSAVIIADHLARECDFFSVGTNDLIQYLLAVDRSNRHVAHIYEPLHPSVLRCLKRIVDVASQEGIPAIVCGEMASDPVHVAVLVALGFDRFSMTPSQIPLITKVICALDRKEALALGDELLELHMTAEIEARLARELPERFPGFFKT
jgi:phosphotransferase system enzyme I (PtsI)